MDKKRPFKLLLVTALLIIPLSLRSSNKPETWGTWVEYTQPLPPNLPTTIFRRHRSSIFKITWFQQPDAIRSSTRLGTGTNELVTPEERTEIRALLEKMTQLTSNNPFSGTQVITLSFLWAGEYYRLSYNETNCPPELQQLLQVTYESKNPCRQQTTSVQKQPEYEFEPLATLPEDINTAHWALLFRITWFKEPFTGDYYELYFCPVLDTEDNFMVYWQDMGDKRNSSVAQLTETERHEVNTLLESMTHIDGGSKPATKNTRITLSFLWRAEYYMLDFDSSNCPADLARLFEIARTVFQRDNPELIIPQNPCLKAQ